MKLVVFVILVACATVAPNATASDDCRSALTTVEVQNCLSAQLRRDEEQLARYLSAAQRQLDLELNERRTGEMEPLPRIDLAEEQRRWFDYRKVHCDSNVYSRWIDGTARGAFATRCDIALTHERTHDLWSAYLRFADSTPPILPEP